MTHSENKSQYTLDRINQIVSDIKNYRSSIKKLKAFALGNLKIDTTPYAPRKIKYTCIPRSETRFLFTLQNMRTQARVLEAELEALIKYGK
jgi:hypothetical protein